MLARRMFHLAVLPVCLLIFTGFYSASSSVQAQAIEQQAESFIDGLAGDAINALTVPGSTEEQRSERFRQLLVENFAVKTIGRWVLGRHWNSATEAEQAEYLDLFQELLIVTYVSRFASYSGEKLKVDKTVANGESDVIVYSSIVRDNSQPPLHVDWRVRSGKDTMKIVDVIVEGVSMGQTQRSEFSSVIRQNGGKVEGLLVELRKRVSKSA